MFQGKVFDTYALLNAIGVLAALLAVAFWVFAFVRLLRNRDQQRGDWMSVALFGTQIGLLVVLAIASEVIRRIYEFRAEFDTWAPPLVLGGVFVLTFISLARALSSSAVIRARMVPACMMWILAVILAISVPTV